MLDNITCTLSSDTHILPGDTPYDVPHASRLAHASHHYTADGDHPATMQLDTYPQTPQLCSVPDGSSEWIALPLKLHVTRGSPVRAILRSLLMKRKSCKVQQ